MFFLPLFGARGWRGATKRGKGKMGRGAGQGGGGGGGGGVGDIALLFL